MNRDTVYKDLVLLGGGHAHLLVLKKLSMRPIRHLRITLVSDQAYAPYSGMLPGHLAGWYDFDQCHIDLVQFCARVGARFINAKSLGLDISDQSVLLAGRPSIHYDVLSINVGSRPDLEGLEAQKNLIPLKPISEFLNKWQGFLRQNQQHGPSRVAMVGGGAAGVEVALILNQRFPDCEIHLFHGAAALLPNHNYQTGRFFLECAKKNKIKVHLNERVTDFDGEFLHLSGKGREKFDFVFWATQAKAYEWFKESGLPTCDRGFILTDKSLKVPSNENIFAAGDCINFDHQNLPKSGVYAVRQAKVLEKNLRAVLLGKQGLQIYRPQKSALALVTTGRKYAVASKGGMFLKGAWVWRLKDKIDRRFMHKFQSLPVMSEESQVFKDSVTPLSSEVINTCGGCGAKVPAEVLERGLKCIAVDDSDDVLVGLKAPDDAVVIKPPAGKSLVTSVDAFRSFTQDDYLLGQVGALHAINDIYAMGAEPKYLQCIVTLPTTLAHRQRHDFVQLMSGVAAALESEKVLLTGGHSVEGSEVSVGFSVQGWVNDQCYWTKAGAKVGDMLILTKGIGTGALLAAHMKGEAKGRWINALWAQLRLSQRAAYAILRRHDVHACTDVTGFGLGGHLLEMCRPDSLRVELYLSNVKVFDGFREVIDQGIEASIAFANSRKIIPAIEIGDSVAVSLPAISADWSILFDPQTNGGLLAALPANEAEACLHSLRAQGYPDATIIGQVIECNNPSGPRFHIGEPSQDLPKPR